MFTYIMTTGTLIRQPFYYFSHFKIYNVLEIKFLCPLYKNVSYETHKGKRSNIRFETKNAIFSDSVSSIRLS